MEKEEEPWAVEAIAQDGLPGTGGRALRRSHCAGARTEAQRRGLPVEEEDCLAHVAA